MILAIVDVLLILLCVTALTHAYIIFKWPNWSYSRRFSSIIYRRPKNLAQLNRHPWLNREEFAQLEKDFPGLRSVVVVSRQVDEPTKSLAHAVLDNFSEGVKYSFFVSPSANPDANLSRYREWFKGLYKTAAELPRTGSQTGPAPDFESCFALHRLPGDWDGVPYVFYTFDDGNRERLLPLKGSEIGVGIATGYARVAESEARTIIDLVSMSSKAFGEQIGVGEAGLVKDIPAGGTSSNAQLYIVQNSAEAA